MIILKYKGYVPGLCHHKFKSNTGGHYCTVINHKNEPELHMACKQYEPSHPVKKFRDLVKIEYTGDPAVDAHLMLLVVTNNVMIEEKTNVD